MWVFTDITDRKRLEASLLKSKEAAERAIEELHMSNSLLEKLFDTTHLSIVFLDRDFNFIRVNRSYALACGFEPDFFPGKNHFALYPHDENEAIFRRMVETGESFSIMAKPFEFPDHPEWGQLTGTGPCTRSKSLKFGVAPSPPRTRYPVAGQPSWTGFTPVGLRDLA